MKWKLQKNYSSALDFSFHLLLNTEVNMAVHFHLILFCWPGKDPAVQERRWKNAVRSGFSLIMRRLEGKYYRQEKGWNSFWSNSQAKPHSIKQTFFFLSCFLELFLSFFGYLPSFFLTCCLCLILVGFVASLPWVTLTWIRITETKQGRGQQKKKWDPVAVRLSPELCLIFPIPIGLPGQLSTFSQRQEAGGKTGDR